MPQPILTSKLPNVGTTIFTVMSQLARTHEAINLSQGFPDFNCDPALVEWVHEAMLAGHNQYAPMPGLQLLRERVCDFVQRHYGYAYDATDEITITDGATEALYASISALVQPGDEVIIFEPAYDAYRPAIEINGGKAVALPLQFPDYRIDWDAVEAHLTNRTRAIVLNSPHNPTGSLMTEEDIAALKELAAKHPFLIISDEVYEHIIFDGAKHLSISRYPELAERAVVISSFGKTLHTTGWKIGYALAPAAITAEIRKVHQFMTFSVGTPFQHAIARYLGEKEEEILGLKDFYQAKRDLFLELMQDSPFEPIACKGTYFQLMKYDGISKLSEKDFSVWLTQEIGVASIPVSAFYTDETDHQVVRFCFAKGDDTLRAAAEVLVGMG